MFHTFQAEAVKKWHQMKKYFFGKCLKLLTHNFKKEVTKVKGWSKHSQKNEEEVFSFFFSLKHDIQDHNNIKLHKVQAYDIWICQYEGMWRNYYNENRGKCRNGSLSHKNGENSFPLPLFKSSEKLECKVFRKMSTEQNGHLNVLLWFHISLHILWTQ